MKQGHRFKDISGQKFGRLTAISFVEMKDKRAYWNFNCECGKQSIVLSGKSVRTGNTKSCGCLWMEAISLPRGEANINAHYLEYKIAAKKCKRNFSLTKEEFKKLTINTKCYYCDAPSRGIDRTNNLIGYEYTNCVSCCKHCNMAKGTKTTSEFLDMVENIHNHMWRNC